MHTITLLFFHALLFAHHTPSIVVAQADKVDCEFFPAQTLSRLRNANATGSVTREGYVPGSSVNSSRIPSGNWTWYTSVNIERNDISQYFAINTSTTRGIKDEDIPFHVCHTAFYDLPKSTYMNAEAQNDPGDCSAMLSPECIRAITQRAEASSGSGDCGYLWGTDPPVECESAFQGQWSGGGSRKFCCCCSLCPHSPAG